MIFSKKNKNYLGETKDMTNNAVHGFYIKDTIYTVQNLGEKDQIVGSRKLVDVQNEPDKYMWSPYAIFAAKLSSKKK